MAPPKTSLGLAIQYALNHWKALNNYLLDGLLDIDKNRTERAIKPFVIERKNFHFEGSHFAAEMADVIYSLIASCKMMNINTFNYINDVLQRWPSTLNKNVSRIFAMLLKTISVNYYILELGLAGRILKIHRLH